MKFIAERFLAHEGSVVKPGNEIELTKSQGDKLLKKKYVSEKPKAKQKASQEKTPQGDAKEENKQDNKAEGSQEKK